MKIKTVTSIKKDSGTIGIFHGFYGDIINIKCVNVEFCCDKMDDAWGEFVVFGEDDSFINATNSAVIVQTMCYPSDAVINHMNIDYCPFCGAKIEIENIKTVEF